MPKHLLLVRSVQQTSSEIIVIKKTSGFLPFSSSIAQQLGWFFLRCHVHASSNHVDGHASCCISRDSESSCFNVLSLSKTRPSICVPGAIIKSGLDDDLLHGSNHLSLYSKHGVAKEKVFGGMSGRDVLTWTSIISAYARRGQEQEALDLFQDMLASDVIPNEYTLSTILRCASSLGAMDAGTRTHAQIVKCGYGRNTVLSTGLIDFYSKCDNLEEASRIFCTMDHHKDTILWTTMISARVHADDCGPAMQLYASMIQSQTPPNEFTFANLLKACASLGPRYGEMVHAHIILWGTKLNLVLKTALVEMYSKCDRMGDALKVFNQTPESDVMLWTTMVCGFTRAGAYEDAIAVIWEMQVAGVPPNSFTYAAILDACSAAPALSLGEQIHSRIVKAGLDHHISVGNALVDLYAKWSLHPEEPACAFHAIDSPNVISWTALIAGFVRHGKDEHAFVAFARMLLAGVQPNSFTLSTILKGCESKEAFFHAEKLHAYVMKTKLDASGVSVGNSLVDVYARSGMADDAWNVFMAMPYRDALTYTSLAKGFNQTGLHRRALDLIGRMQRENLKMDAFSLSSFLSASAGLSAPESGKQLHCYSVKFGLDGCTSVSNGLVHMYGKCGSTEDAHRVFMGIQEPNVVSWNGLMSGLASNGHFSKALSAFEDMRLAGAQPDEVTFLLVLYACSHGGMVDLGVDYFNSMGLSYSVPAQLDHYVCLVDMLGRAGRLEEAASAIEKMPFQPDALIYKTLLGGCKLHRNLLLGEWTARRALEINPSDPAVYVLLASVYDDAGKLQLAEQIRRMMKERGVRKCPGQSWV